MKLLLMSMWLLLPSLGLAQHVIPSLPVDTTTGQIAYRQEVLVPGASKAELFHRARRWFATNFADYKQVVSVEDSTSGEIIGTYSTILNQRFLLAYNHYAIYRTLRIAVASGRYYYELTNFRQRNIALDNHFYVIRPDRPSDMNRFGKELVSQTHQNTASLQATMHASD